MLYGNLPPLQIKAVRTRAGLSLAQLAVMSGIDAKKLRQYENHYELPSLQEVIAIAHACNSTTDDLFLGEDESISMRHEIQNSSVNNDSNS